MVYEHLTVPEEPRVKVNITILSRT